jgi:hypothetical protein
MPEPEVLVNMRLKKTWAAPFAAGSGGLLMAAHLAKHPLVKRRAAIGALLLLPFALGAWYEAELYIDRV